MRKLNSKYDSLTVALGMEHSILNMETFKKLILRFYTIDSRDYLEASHSQEGDVNLCETNGQWYAVFKNLRNGYGRLKNGQLRCEAIIYLYDSNMPNHTLCISQHYNLD
jgi:hypothetical protein